MPHYQVPLVGMHFRPPAKAILQVLPLDHPLHIEPEPGNEYDSNALMVKVKSAEIPTEAHSDLDVLAGGFGYPLADILAQEQWHLGYIARGEAAHLAPMLSTFQVKMAKLGFGGDGKPVVNMELEPRVKGTE